MKKLKITATMDNFDEIMGFVLKRIKELKVEDKKLINRLRVACEEALINIIRYAYSDKVGQIEIIYNFFEEDKKIRLEIIDEGIAFNPLEMKVPDLTLPLEEKSIGGLGIYLMKKIMDDIKYKRGDGKNILILTKTIENS